MAFKPLLSFTLVSVAMAAGVGCKRVRTAAGELARDAVEEPAAAAPSRPKDAIWQERPAGAIPQGFIPPTSLAPLVKELKPCVVNISTTQVVKRARVRTTPGGTQDDPFGQFFDRFFGGEGGGGSQVRQSLGSGFVINAKGLVITNNHVIEDAAEIKVKLSDGREFPAEVVGHDPKTDVALLKLNGDVHDVPVAYLGDSDVLEVGDWVIAIGDPFGLDHTVSHGIVSAKERVIGAGPYDDFIQTDAPINPGNSGGPLFNVRGEVVGVATAILSPDGRGSVGIGFAVPVNVVKDELPQLEQIGHVTRGWLGVTIQDLTPEIATSMNLGTTRGAVVNDVFPGGPADKGGIRIGDVVIELNSKKVENFNQLLRGVAGITPGGEAHLLVLRDGKKLPMTMKVSQRPDDEGVTKGPGEGDRLGLKVGPLSADLSHSLGIPDGRGVAVLAVREDSPAFAAGVRPGDVIVEVNRRPVQGPDEYSAIVARVSAGDLVLLRVQRQNASLYIAVRAT